MNDQARLEKLAYDANANVVEAALPAMRRLKIPGADAAAVAALAHEGLQAVRAAALLLKESPPERRLFRPLATSLLRITRIQSETSRDARLALLDAIAVHVVGDDALELAPLLKDFDPRVAEKTAEIMEHLVGIDADFVAAVDRLHHHRDVRAAGRDQFLHARRERRG